MSGFLPYRLACDVTWLNDNSGALIVLANLVLVGITIGYVRLTGSLAKSARQNADLARKQLRLSTMPIVLGHKLQTSTGAPATVRVFCLKAHALNVSVDVYAQNTRLGGAGPTAIWLPGKPRRIQVGSFTLPKGDGYEVVIEYYDAEGKAYRTRRSSLLAKQSSVTIEVHDFDTAKTEVLVQGTTIADLPPLGSA